MRPVSAVLPLALFVATACSGGSSGSRAAPVEGGPEGDGGSGSDGGFAADVGPTGTPDGGSPRVDGGGPGSDGGSDAPDAGTTVKPGNGCAAGLGIDAGFYTCSAQYFVSPTGSDSNSGTSMSAALKTLGAATKLPLKGGDCVTVADGTYGETVLVTSSGSADTCTGYVVFRSASPGGAKVVSSDPYNGFMVNSNYVMVDGFDLHDTSTGSAFTAGTNTLSNGKVIVYHHIAAIRNVAHDSGGAGLGALHADYVRFEGNTVYGNSSRSTYGDSGIDLWDSLVENNVIWGNGGRGIEASGAQPTSHVTIRNNTVWNDNVQQQQYGGSEIVSWGNGNAISNNIVILGPDAQNGTAANQTTVAIADRCGPSSAGVQITGGSTWANNLVYTMKTGAPLSSSNCVTTPSSYTTIPVGSNLMGVDPGLAAQTSTAALSVQDFTIGAGSPATHKATGADFAPYDFAYVTRPVPPSIGAFEP